MYEVEIKAHVKDYDSVKKRLEHIAKFESRIEKEDFYYCRFKENGEKLKSIRIRKESVLESGKKNPFTRFVVNYKSKESQNGTEVNRELESTIENPEVIKAFLLDTGHKMYLHKKKVSDFFSSIVSICNNDLQCHLELVEVPPLGYFLEIEIMCPDENEDMINSAQKELYRLIDECGLKKEDIEHRYYSELLAAIKEKP